MHEVTKRISFCYGHRLLKHPGKCSHYHGHNGLVEVTCSKDKLNEQGMVVDFDEIREALKSWIDEKLDHRMILNEKDPLVQFLKDKKEPHLTLPGEPTAEAIAKLIYDEALMRKLPVSQVTLWETPTAGATYRT